MENTGLVQECEAEKPWLKSLIAYVIVNRTGTRVIYCWHQEQLSICGQCAPKADEAYLEYKQARKG